MSYFDRVGGGGYLHPVLHDGLARLTYLDGPLLAPPTELLRLTGLSRGRWPDHLSLDPLIRPRRLLHVRVLPHRPRILCPQELPLNRRRGHLGRLGPLQQSLLTQSLLLGFGLDSLGILVLERGLLLVDAGAAADELLPVGRRGEKAGGGRKRPGRGGASEEGGAGETGEHTGRRDLR